MHFFPLWVFVTIVKSDKKWTAATLSKLYLAKWFIFNFAFRGSINLKESLMGTSIIQDWAENCLSIIASYIYSNEATEWKEVRSAAAQQLSCEEDFLLSTCLHREMLYCMLLDEICHDWSSHFYIRGREQETMRRITFNSLLEKGHFKSVTQATAAPGLLKSSSSLFASPSLS